MTDTEFILTGESSVFLRCTGTHSRDRIEISSAYCVHIMGLIPVEPVAFTLTKFSQAAAIILSGVISAVKQVRELLIVRCCHHLAYIL